MKRIVWRIAAVLVGLLLLAVVAGIVVVRSDWFRDYLRRSIVEQARNATGAQVDIGGFSFDWSAMRANVSGLVLHGKETAGDPLLRVDSATLGFRIISIFERSVDLQSLRVQNPQVRVILYPDGSTNIPGPGTRPDKLWTEDLLNVKIGQYELADGTFDYDDRRTPISARGENLRLRMSYSASAPSYQGELSSDSITVKPEGEDEIKAALSTKFTLERNRVSLADLNLTSNGVTAQLNGALDDLRAPHGTLSLTASVPLKEVVSRFKLPIKPLGSAAFSGKVDVSFADGFDFRARGNVSAQGVGYRQGRVNLEDVALRGNADISREGASLTGIEAQALGAIVTADARFNDWNTLHVEGRVDDLNMRRAAALLTDRPVAWNGTLGGRFVTDVPLSSRERTATAQALLQVAPLPEGDPARGDPLQGHVDLLYNQARGTLALGSSSLATFATQLDVSGTLGATLRVHARSTRLDDLMPAIALVSDTPIEIPLKLNNGSIVLDGTVIGELTNPRFQGQVTVLNGEVRDHRFDRFSAAMTASRAEIEARNISATRGRMEVTGTANITSQAGTYLSTAAFSTANTTVQLNARNAPIAELAKEVGIALDISGTAGGAIRLSGSLNRPEVDASIDVQTPALLGERMDRARANIRYLPGELDLTNGVINDAGSELRFTAAYRHPDADWRSGDVSFDADTQNLPASRLESVAALRPKVAAILNGNIHGAGRISGGRFTLTSASADAGARSVTLEGQAIGNFTLKAQTEGANLTASVNGNIHESRVQGTGAWRLEGDAPGTAKVQFSRIDVASIQQLVMFDRPEAAPASLDGFVEGDATVTVALQKLSAFQVELRLANVEFAPKQNPAPQLNLRPEDITVRNSGPVVVDITAATARVRTAQFTGRNTRMEVSGTVPFSRNGGADLTVRGNIDLSILQLLRPDLVAEGTAAVEVAVRGNIQDPNVNGRMDVSKASLFLADIPSVVVENAQGTVLFDRNRATVQKLTAQTGNGGQASLTGFVDFGDVLVYRMQAEIRRFRVRYPQDISTTFDADLRLNGTSAASTLSGAVILNRTSLTANADLGTLLAQSQATEPDYAQNSLRGMQLDLRVQNSSNFQFETSMTTGVEADIDLRLRGTPSRPSLQGSIVVNRGEVTVYGNRYTLERGDIRFLNPFKIEPTLDVDLSTRARGVAVNISASGTPAKIKMNYSSDPPLLQSEIITLLAVGRDPTTAGSQIAPGTPGDGSTALQTGGSLLGQAAAAQVTNRLQRFFGASRVKIDPTLTGVDNLPQARVTLEQQVSKDVTLTYITNLNRTQEQIVRVQWDLSPQWSAIAVRDQNGVFGIDFQYRKRF